MRDAVWIAVNGGPIGWFIEKLEVTYPAAGMHCSAQMTGSEKERQLERSVFWEPLKNQPSWVWDDSNLESITFIIFGSCLILISRYISIKQACELWTEHHAANSTAKFFETLTLSYCIPQQKHWFTGLEIRPVLKWTYDTFSWQLPCQHKGGEGWLTTRSLQGSRWSKRQATVGSSMGSQNRPVLRRWRWRVVILERFGWNFWVIFDVINMWVILITWIESN